MLTKPGQALVRLIVAFGRSLADRLMRIVLASMLGAVTLPILGVAWLEFQLAHRPVPLTGTLNTLMSLSHPRNAPSVGGAVLTLGAWQAGYGRALNIHVTGAHLNAVAGQTPAISIGEMSASFPLIPLLTGRFRPEWVEASRLDLNLLRDAQGQIVIDQSRPIVMGNGDDTTWLTAISALRYIRIIDATITMADARINRRVILRDLNVDMRRTPNHGIQGEAVTQLVSAGTVLNIFSDIDLSKKGAGQIVVSAASFETQSLAGLVPDEDLTILDAPISLRTTLTLQPGLHVSEVQIGADIGSGLLHIPKTTTPTKLAGGRIEAAVSEPFGPSPLATLTRLDARLAPSRQTGFTTLSATGTAKWVDQELRSSLRLTFDQINLPALGTLWPSHRAEGAREWITANILNGVLSDGSFQAELRMVHGEAPEILTASGQLQANGLEIHWLRPVPPLVQGRAKLTLLSPDTVQIDIQGGRQRSRSPDTIAMHHSLMKITGLSQKDQQAQIDTVVSGDISALAGLLAEPRLHLLSTHPFPLHDPSGRFTASLHVGLPLDRNVTIDQVAIRAAVALNALHLGQIALGKDLNDGQLSVIVDNKGLSFKGDAKFASLPADITAKLDFSSGNPDQVLTSIDLISHLDGRQLAEAGYNPGHLIDGYPTLWAHYRERRSGKAQAQLETDLTQATLNLPQARWRKPAGVPGFAHAIVDLEHNTVTGVQDLQIEGPLLHVHGTAEYQSGMMAVLRLSQLEIGRTQADGKIVFPTRQGAPLVGEVKGSVLDLAGLFDPASRQNMNINASTLPLTIPWQLTARFDQVFLRGQLSLTDLDAQAESDGSEIQTFTLSSHGPEQLMVRLRPAAKGSQLTIHTEDAGAIFHAFGALHHLDGGTLEMFGHVDHAHLNPRLYATAHITNVDVRLSESGGWLSDGHISLKQGIIPFQLDQQALVIKDAHAANTAVGATAHGMIDFDHDRFDVRGTLVPFFLLNAAPGQIPILGKLFRPAPGGGLFGLGYQVKGSLNDPVFTVEPLSLLAPGITQRLLQ